MIRILDQATVPLNMETLGFFPDTLSTFRPMVSAPYGMILVTGPTGSGKTTTLYAALREITSSERKIITIEDPVKYQIPSVIQIQVKPQIGRRSPRVSLHRPAGPRRDPRRGDPRPRDRGDRDPLRAHRALALSTLHTNDASGVVTRLLEMGVEEYLLPSVVVGVLARGQCARSARVALLRATFPRRCARM